MARPELLSVALLLAGIGSLGTHARDAGAQQGVTSEVLAQGMPTEAGGQQLTLLRITFAQDGALAPHRHSGPMLLYIEAGTLGYTLMEGTAEIVRAGAASGTAGSATAPEVLLPGAETMLQAGDRLLERGVVHAARNPGSNPTVVLISALLAPGQPVTQLVEAARP